MKNVPKGWARTTIGEIAELVNGRAFKTSEWTSDGLPIVRIQNLNRQDAPFNRYSGPVAEKHMVRAGDLLFAWSGTPGTSFGAHVWRGPDAVLNQHIFNVRIDNNLADREFLRFLINHSLDEQIEKAHGGAGLQHVTKSAFEATEISLPPLQHQRRIVRRLKTNEEKLERAISHLEAVVEAADAGRMQLLESAYDLSMRPQFAKDAVDVAVGDIASDISYGSSAKSKKIGDVPVLRMGNIQDGELDWTDLVYTSDQAEIAKYALSEGDLLFNRTNSPQLVGKTAVFHGQRSAIYAGYLIRVRCSEAVVPDYLAHCLNSPSGRDYCQQVKSDGVSQSNINAKKLAAFRFRCPSTSVQAEVVRLVATSLRRLRKITEQANASMDRVRTLHRRLIDQALAGEMVAVDGSDEIAELQVEQLIAAKNSRKSEEANRIATGTIAMDKSVEQILKQANGWISSQDAARQYGIGFGTETEQIEPFYAELRDLAAAGRLLREPIKDGSGMKVGDRLCLKD